MMGPFRSQYFNGSSPLAAIRKVAPDAKVTSSTTAATSPPPSPPPRPPTWSWCSATSGWARARTRPTQVAAARRPGRPDRRRRRRQSQHRGGAADRRPGDGMPWLSQAGAVVEAWYSGAKGGEAIADVLFGVVDPSGRLPMTFPASIGPVPARPAPAGPGPARTRTRVRRGLFRGARTSATAASPRRAPSRCSRSATACPMYELRLRQSRR
ncbi:glycoside hydrolase family 3 protein [Caulobacter segnis]